MKNLVSRLTTTVLIAALSTSVSVPFANAHAVLDLKEAQVNSYQRIAVRIGHGCDDQATQKVTVNIPEGIISVKPMPKSGWQLETVKGDYANEYSVHGKPVTSGVKQLVWSEGELSNEYFDEFVFQARLTDNLPAGEMVFVPIQQDCADGKLSWSEIPAKGQDPHDLKSPAPGLMIVAAEVGHGGHSKAMAMEAIKVGDLEITSPMIRATPPKAPVSAGYMVIRNNGTVVDRLIGGEASFAGKVEVHEMKMDGEVMKMRKVAGGLEIPAGGEVTLQAGGLHIMFMKMQEQMKEGEVRKVTLEFEKAGKVEFELPVKTVEGSGHKKHGMKK